MLARKSGCSCSAFGFEFDPRELAAAESFLFFASLLAGKCNLAIKGRGALVDLSKPRTQTNPAKHFY